MIKANTCCFCPYIFSLPAFPFSTHKLFFNNFTVDLSICQLDPQLQTVFNKTHLFCVQ